MYSEGLIPGSGLALHFIEIRRSEDERLPLCQTAKTAGKTHGFHAVGRYTQHVCQFCTVGCMILALRPSAIFQGFRSQRTAQGASIPMAVAAWRRHVAGSETAFRGPQMERKTEEEESWRHCRQRNRESSATA